MNISLLENLAQYIDKKETVIDFSRDMKIKPCEFKTQQENIKILSNPTNVGCILGSTLLMSPYMAAAVITYLKDANTQKIASHMLDLTKEESNFLFYPDRSRDNEILNWSIMSTEEMKKEAVSRINWLISGQKIEDYSKMVTLKDVINSGSCFKIQDFCEVYRWNNEKGLIEVYVPNYDKWEPSVRTANQFVDIKVVDNRRCLFDEAMTCLENGKSVYVEWLGNRIEFQNTNELTKLKQDMVTEGIWYVKLS